MALLNYIVCRFFRPIDYWHNRYFDSRFRAHELAPGEWSVYWQNQAVPSSPLSHLSQVPHDDTCNIIASGPSLASIRHPERLFNAFSVCVNGSFRMAAQCHQQSDLYLVSDGGFIRRRFADFSEGARLSRRVLMNHLMLFSSLDQASDGELSGLPPVYLYEDPNRPFRKRVSQRLKEVQTLFRPGEDFIESAAKPRVLISRNPQLGIAENQSVVCIALQAARFMGFRRVNIFGMDLGGQQRFYAEKGTPESSRLDKDYQDFLLPWFTAFAKHCCGPEFRVWNCSPHSRLPDEVLPKCDPNAVLEDSPVPPMPAKT